MKKINLEKQKIVSLSNDELADVKGGGPRRSNRRNGDCRYSRKNPAECYGAIGYRDAFQCGCEARD